MQKPKVVPEKINLEGIRILKAQFELDSDDDLIPEMASLVTGLKSISAFDLEENRQKFKLFVKVKGLDESGDEIGIYGEYHIEFYFTIENLDEFVTHGENDSFTVSDLIGATIAGIAYSTARGIILNRTLITDFNGVILPIINPHNLLEEDSFTEL